MQDRSPDVAISEQAIARAMAAADWAQAETLLAALVARYPSHADGWFDRGWVARRRRQFALAVDCYRQAASHSPALGDACAINEAVVLSEDLGDTPAALAALQRRDKSGEAPVPVQLAAGQIHEDLGDSDAATARYRNVIAVEPRNARAWSRLAAIAVHRGQAAAMVDEIERAISSAADLDARADLLFAAGNLFDAVGDYHRAGQAVEAANLIAASLIPQRYDPAREEALSEALVRTFRAPLPSVELPDAGGAGPIFIFGMFRSGSTLVETLCAKHPEVTGGGELETIPALMRRFPQGLPSREALTASGIGALRTAYFNAAPAVLGKFTDKRCDNYRYLPLIAAMFSNAPLIHTRRHPLDIITSTWFLRFDDGMLYTHDISAAAHAYVQYARLMAEWEQRVPSPVATVDYEELVQDPTKASERVHRAAGLQPSEHATDMPSSIRTAASWQVRRPLHTQSVGRWHHYDRFLKPAVRVFEQAGIAF